MNSTICINDQTDDVQPEEEERRSREIRKPSRLNDNVTVAEVCEPETYQSAMKSKEAQEAKEAMDQEISLLAENKTWHLVDLPVGENIIISLDRFKARSCCQEVLTSSRDQLGRDFQSYNTVRTILSVAAFL